VLLPHTTSVSENWRLLLKDQAWYWSYLVNILIALDGWTPVPGTVGHFWSLAVEEQFYLFWPVVVFLFRRRSLVTLCLILIALSFALRVALNFAGLQTAAYVLTPARMDTLAVGALLALAVREPNWLATLSRFVVPVFSFSLVSLAAIFAWRRDLGPESFVVQTIGYTVIAFLCGAVLIIATTSPPGTKIVRGLSHPTLASFGYYSYALYVFHLPIASFLEQHVLSVRALPTVMGSSLPGQTVFTIVATGISFALAFLSWRLYEVRFLKLKALFPYRPKILTSGKEQCEVTPISIA
jgi:peptidoglycan/LPS O-acetylase OafA/YrhL